VNIGVYKSKYERAVVELHNNIAHYTFYIYGDRLSKYGDLYEFEMLVIYIDLSIQIIFNDSKKKLHLKLYITIHILLKLFLRIFILSVNILIIIHYFSI